MKRIPLFGHVCVQPHVLVKFKNVPIRPLPYSDTSRRGGAPYTANRVFDHHPLLAFGHSEMRVEDLVRPSPLNQYLTPSCIRTPRCQYGIQTPHVLWRSSPIRPFRSLLLDTSKDVSASSRISMFGSLILFELLRKGGVHHIRPGLHLANLLVLGPFKGIRSTLFGQYLIRPPVLVLGHPRVQVERPIRPNLYSAPCHI